MHIHFLGICGTFMASLAVIAKQLNHTVTGQDANAFPPMSTVLETQGIKIIDNYAPEHLPKDAIIVVGNIMTRGMPIVEHMLNNNFNFTSGPNFLNKLLLKDKHVLAVAGTHGKTTTTSMLAWILTYAGLKPGYLIGGVANNFTDSASIGDSDYFVIEADEYDSAFFDKRSKFIHYKPSTLVLNNLEYDHADIFKDLDAIKTQFHHLVRTVPSNGNIIVNNNEANLKAVLTMGCWTPVTTFGNTAADFHLSIVEKLQDKLIGEYNLLNALAATIAASKVGVSFDTAIAALKDFKGVKRRLELKGSVNGINIYDDFAHHPTAVKGALAGIKNKVTNKNRIVAVLDISSNSMKLGSHKDKLVDSFTDADCVYFYENKKPDWDPKECLAKINKPGGVFQDINKLEDELVDKLQAFDELVFMSNGNLKGIHDRIISRI